MKKLLLMGVIATAAITTASAQVSFGPRAGVNFANQTKAHSDFEDTKSKTGFLVGLAANFGMNDLISIQPEVLYSQAGYKVTGDGGYKSTTALNYLQVPVLLKATFGDGDTKFHANVGPYVGYLMSGKTKVEDEDGSEEWDIEFKEDEDGDKANRLDVGLMAGVGVGRQVGAGMMSLDLRYGLGMSDMTSWKNDRPSELDKVSNRVLSLSLSYMFGGN